MLELQHLTAKAGKKTIISDISETFNTGNVYAVMGPNGSGKSTLAKAILGYPNVNFSQASKVLLHGEDITMLPIEKRVKKGLFMTHQNPEAIEGVSVLQVLQYALEKTMTSEEIRKKAILISEKLGISKELLERPLNVSFSGGEKKKLEVLQAAVMNPDLIIFDEIDTGVDVDALKSIALVIEELREDPKKVFIFITHYPRILDYIKPNMVLVMKNGHIVDKGTHKLAKEIDSKGYEGYNA